jgi:hypothetical protein
MVPVPFCVDQELVLAHREQLESAIRGLVGNYHIASEELGV